MEDTRATPDDTALSGAISLTCIYSGNLTVDCNGSIQTYNPEIRNIMAYGRRECRREFSGLQLLKLRIILQDDPVIKKVWFDPPGNITIAPVVGFPHLILNWASYFSGNIITIGNRSSGINVTIGGSSSIQKFAGSQKIIVGPGVRIFSLASAPEGQVILKAGDFCTQ